MRAKAIYVLFFLALGLLLASCTTYRKCQQKYGARQDSTYIHIKQETILPVEVITPQDRGFATIQIDSLLLWKAQDTIRIISQQKRAEVKLWKDRYNYLNAELLVPADTVRDTVEVVLEVVVPCPPQTIFEPPPPWYQRGIGKGIAILILLLIMSLIVILIFKLRPFTNA